MERTLIQLKSDFADMADKHKQINSFFWGNFVDAINQDDVDYPLMCCTLQPSQIGDSYTGVDLQVIICDKYNEQDYRMIDEVHSDMLRILKDIDVTLKQFRFQDYLDVETDFSTEPFINEGQDVTAGWGGIIRMRVHDYENRCAIPYDGFDFDGSTTGTGCSSGINNIQKSDGTLIQAVSVPSGGTVNSPVADSVITLNTNEVTTNVKATDSKNFNLLDTDGNPIGVDSVSGDNVSLFADSTGSFKISVRTNNAGVTNNNQIMLPIQGSNIVINWGDATSQTVTQLNAPDGTVGSGNNVIHTYANAGTYEISITGGLDYIYMVGTTDRSKLLSINQWGTIQWKSFRQSFWDCQNMNIYAVDTPDFNYLTNLDLDRMFARTFQMIGNKYIEEWDFAGKQLVLENMFNDSDFNQPLNNLNVSSIERFANMFSSSDFNQNIGGWNLKQIASTMNMFKIFAFSAMSTANYTDTIVGWANYVFNNGGLPSGVSMGDQTGMTYDTARAGGANFANAGAARTYLTGTALWTISGDTVI